LCGLMVGGTAFSQETPAPKVVAPAPAPVAAGTNAPVAPLRPAAPSGLQRDPRLQRMIEQRMMKDLTPEQQAKLQEANDSYRKITAPLEERLLRLRNDIEAAVNADVIDEPGIRAKAQQLAAVEGDIAVARALRNSKLRGFLNAEQVKRMQVPQPGMRPPAAFPGSIAPLRMTNAAAARPVAPAPAPAPAQPAAEK